METLFIIGVILALLFNFVNGLNDAGNSIATVVATRALSPLKALILCAVCNIAGPFLLTSAIARTIGTSVVIPSAFTLTNLCVALIAGVLLIGVVVHIGIPISASHALIGCMMGAAIAAAGPSVIFWPSIESVQAAVLAGLSGALCGSLSLAFLSWMLQGPVKIGAFAGAIGGFSLMIVALMLLGLLKISGILTIFIFIFISPTIGFICAFTFDIIISYCFRFTRQSYMRKIFRPFIILTGALQAIGHGANDGMHAVGVISSLFIAAGMADYFVAPFWVITASAVAIGFGTIFGSWNVITKMAKGITRIRPYQGFCASIAGGFVISALTISGIPSSSTHIISGSIIGVGATRGCNAVDWRVVREIVTTWVITLPVSIATAYLLYLLITFIQRLM